MILAWGCNITMWKKWRGLNGLYMKLLKYFSFLSVITEPIVIHFDINFPCHIKIKSQPWKQSEDVYCISLNLYKPAKTKCKANTFISFHELVSGSFLSKSKMHYQCQNEKQSTLTIALRTMCGWYQQWLKLMAAVKISLSHWNSFLWASLLGTLLFSYCCDWLSAVLRDAFAAWVCTDTLEYLCWILANLNFSCLKGWMWDYRMDEWGSYTLSVCMHQSVMSLAWIFT